jgi:hypothetical protein
VAFTKVLTYIIYIILEFTPSIILIYTPFPILEIVSTGIIFPLHSCVHSIRTIFTLLHPFPSFSPFHCTNQLRQDVFHPLVFHFCKRKKMIFFVVYTVSFLMTFPCIYVL